MFFFFSINFTFGRIEIPVEVEKEENQVFDLGYDITDVYNTLEFNKSFNEKLFGVKNPDLIFPGQELLFLLPDGTWAMPLVKKGDTQEAILKRIFRQKEEALIRASLEEDDSSETDVFYINESKKEYYWVWPFVTGIAVSIILLLILCHSYHCAKMEYPPQY